MQPAAYQAWYQTPRGSWIAQREFTLLMQLLQPSPGQSLLDIGCGTGQFSRCFRQAGLEVTGVDPDPAMLAFARGHKDAIRYIRGNALQLPFETEAFDFCAAVTSLCFVSAPQRAAREMWRVSRRGIVLGLLNRHSLLYALKRGSGGYQGARWDTIAEALSWLTYLDTGRSMQTGSAVWFPSGGCLARHLEPRMPRRPGWGGFLALAVRKPG
jgi:SAM-dependent methyltransferase